MTFRDSVPLVAGIVVLAAVVAAFLHPDGPAGLLTMVGLRSGDRTASADPTRPTTPAVARPAAAVELAKADRNYDAGEFDLAATFYAVAQTVAKTDRDRERATRGLHRAVLGLSLIRNPDPPDGSLGPHEEVYAKLLHVAETVRTEDAWIIALRFAAGADLKSHLPEALRGCLDTAVVGGSVEKRLINGLGRMGQHEKAYRYAMLELGFGRGEIKTPIDGGPTATTPFPSYDDDDDDGESGIGGSARGAIPFGSFSRAMQKRLREAVALEAEGLDEFKAAGPQGTNRKEHRRRAAKCLVSARDIYNDALEEDADSSDLNTRYKRVMTVLAQLRKERAIDE